MYGKFLLISAVLAIVLLSGCPDDSGTGYAALRDYSGEGPFDDPNTTYYDTGEYPAEDSNPGDCGFFEGPCCSYIGTDPWGMVTGYNYCNDDLECRADTCVEGPEYEAYDRTTGWD
ncbi:MAG: hypothetical protein ABID38_02895 [Candidatus Diapherotrites archaeon]